MRRCLLIAVLLIALPVTTFGQPPAMSGLVRHRTTGQPIECLHVALADSLDRTVAHTVTDSAGMFVLVAPDTGSYRVQFDVAGSEPLTGPLTRLAAGEMNEQEYPLSFDKRIGGELELIRHAKKAEVVDLGDWHPSQRTPHPSYGTRVVSEAEIVHASANAVEQWRVVAQFIVDTTGRVRAGSWRTIVTTDDAFATTVRNDLLGHRYEPARIGDQRVCQLVMMEQRAFRTGRANTPLK